MLLERWGTLLSKRFVERNTLIVPAEEPCFLIFSAAVETYEATASFKSESSHIGLLKERELTMDFLSGLILSSGKHDIPRSSLTVRSPVTVRCFLIQAH